MKYGWLTRMDELAAFPVSVSWDQVWPLLALAQIEPGASTEVRRWLFRHRYLSWLLSLSVDPSSCRYCGERKPCPSRSDRLFCSDGCRVSAHQASDRGASWPLSEVSSWASSQISLLLVDAKHLEARLLGLGCAGIVPPDLASYDNLPPLPDRCEGGCGGPCRWTRGGPCLYAGTAQET